METVCRKKIPSSQMIKKVKGRTFHLPMPLEQTLKKLPIPTDPINFNHELFVLVRSVPTANKVIWENIVDIQKVYKALVWLKHNNYLYKQIELPLSGKELLNNIDTNISHNIQKSKNDKYSLDNDDLKDSGFLTEIASDHEFYEQYTIFPLYDKKKNKSASQLYQMLKVSATAMNNFDKYLDISCYPDLYSFGINGQHENRKVYLSDSDFIKNQLMSKCSKFRLNIQYFFSLLNDANMRQI